MSQVRNIEADTMVQDNMMDYGAYAILHRALPDVRDGMKPVYRRILTAMFMNKYYKLIKSSAVNGDVMKIHPHGDTYPTMVGMAQKDRHLIRYIDSKGNFGQYTSRDLAYAAMRYTEVKLSEAGKDLMDELSKKVVDYIPSFDGAVMLPEVLPVKYPVVLTQAQSGVAYGMASSTASYNIVELVKAMTDYIREGKKVVLIPDFPTGGYIVKDTETFKKINLEGRGSVQIRGKVEIDGNNIFITEIPYTTTREAIIDKIVDLSKTKLKEVAEVKDLTDIKGLKIRVRFKRGTDVKVGLEKLYQMTPLQSSYSSNMNMLVNGYPKVLGVWSVIEEWLKWRKEVVIKGYTFDINKMTKELHFLRGLEKVLLDIDSAIEIIRHSQDDLIEVNLMTKFNIDEVQAKEIADMKLRQINEKYILNKIKDIKKLEDKIEDFKDLVANDKRLDEVIISDLEDAAKKYGTERRSKLVEVNTEKIKEIKKQVEAIPNFAVKLILTREGYVKKIGINADIKSQYVKPGDAIVNAFVTENHGEILVFGSDKCCHKIKISELEESTPKALGTFIPSISEVKDIVGYSVLDTKDRFIIIGYDNNKIAKVNTKSFEGNRKKLMNSLSKSANVVNMLTFNEEGTFAFKTDKTAFKMNTTQFETKERYGQGVYGPRNKGKLIQLIKIQ